MHWLCLLIGIIAVIPCSSSVLAAPLAEAVSADGTYRAVLSVSPDRPSLADTITLMLDVTCPHEETVEFPPFGESIGDLDITDIRRTDRQLTLSAIPRHAGTTPIWAIPIRCGEQYIEIPFTELSIIADIDTENASLDDIGLTIVIFPERQWHIYMMTVILGALAVILLWLFFRRKKTDIAEESSPLSAQEIALRRLAELLESRKHESDIKGFFVELSDIVRWYVERLTGIRAPELTTEEFLNKIARPANRSWGGMEQQPVRFTGSLETLVPFLESADIVKFAKHVPTYDEMMLAFRRAEDFLRKESGESNRTTPVHTSYTSNGEELDVLK